MQSKNLVIFTTKYFDGFYISIVLTAILITEIVEKVKKKLK